MDKMPVKPNGAFPFNDNALAEVEGGGQGEVFQVWGFDEVIIGCDLEA